MGGKPGSMIRGCLRNSSLSTGCLLSEAITTPPWLAQLKLQVRHLQKTSLDLHFEEVSEDQKAQAHKLASVLHFSVAMGSECRREQTHLDSGELHSKALKIRMACHLW